ncbi:tigr00004: reactive intermediate/imine deaminase [Trichococcus palustris]|uniref:Tigr00004: reactive intermediate/imine deaminase n=1 Tax=Trichococcus palustris TaxID=140314 RepID=A0A143YY39_9LACT|nr:RidA family protein [Trichococcus palustris]CZQ98656.1 tigr00004: reactive intermediate/imine deaminase [Trichococcus palustris]SFK94221.1 2-iminobutanoate/2-iminopropanoate deaminase [Trichococcus palustris]
MQNTIKAVGPYSAYRKSGNLIFISGQLPIDPNTNAIVSGNIEEQTEQSLKNLKELLEEQNLDMSAIVKTTVFLADIKDFNTVNEIYSGFFESPYPSRSAFQVAALPKGALIEIEAIAQGE